MKCRDIASVMERLAPRTLAYDWDNVGLLSGDMEQEVDTVMLTLDLEMSVVEEAKKCGAQMILAHHPIMFDPVKRITEQTPDGRLLRALIKNDISFYAAHTNLDIAKGGLNDLLASKVGLTDVRILELTNNEGAGIGRIGNLEKPVTLTELASKLKKALNLDFLRYSGDDDGIVSKVAVNTGGGTSLIDAAKKEGADVFITGDYTYSQVRAAVEDGMKIIDAGHYDTEIIVCELFSDYLSDKFGDALTIHESRTNVNVLKFM